MFCKSGKGKRVLPLFIVVGLVLLIFGVVYARRLPADASNINMLMGMFAGLGSALAAIGVIKLIHYKKAPDEKLKKEEIELKDERNVQILRAAYSVSSATATVLFAAMAFIFVWLNYFVPAFISLGAMLVQRLVFFIASKYFKERM